MSIRKPLFSEAVFMCALVEMTEVDSYLLMISVTASHITQTQTQLDQFVELNRKLVASRHAGCLLTDQSHMSSKVHIFFLHIVLFLAKYL